MNLKTPYPFWLMRNGFLKTYPACGNDLKTDVAVVGAGITGALTAYMLAKAGLGVTVLEKRHPGMGSTAASTALLQYEIDEPLHSLIEKSGRKRAEAAYRACYEAIDSLAAIVAKERIEADFEKVPSLQYASYKKDVVDLEKELDARRKLDFDVEILGEADLRGTYGFSAPAALLSSQGGEVDAYRLAHGLLGAAGDAATTYDCCEVLDIQSGSSQVKLVTDAGATITARYAVLACGYETLKYLPSTVATVGATYALATKPVSEDALTKNRTLLWETKDPYLYVRYTSDNRIMAGGRDDETNNPKKRDQALPRKIQGLLKDLGNLFPGIALVPDYTWAGAFGSTKDSLGYVDAVPGRPGVFCNLGFGGNGILYSLIGAEIIRDRILDKKNDRDDVFAFDR